MPTPRKAAAKTTRRMGPVGSEIWHSMLDGAEEVLREEGYGALSSRTVAERIGVKQRLVYYYFASMDDLIVETFKRLAVRELDRLSKALESPQPLEALWAVFTETADTRLVSEFVALANRSELLRREVKKYVVKAREIQVSALDQSHGDAPGLPPAAAVILATGAALLLNREAALGVRMGHDETLAAIKGFIAQRSAPARRKKRSS